MRSSDDGGLDHHVQAAATRITAAAKLQDQAKPTAAERTLEPRKWARAYARHGGLVLPLHTPTPDGGCSCHRTDCPHPGKHPRVLHGKDDATSDLYTVTRWWRAWPEANVGLRPRPGQIVVDVDPRNGGDRQLTALQARYGRLPLTLTARTGSGGLHIWFTCPGEVRGRLAEGIDIKTHSGCVVVAPSLHASGERYVWTHEVPIAPAPDYLRALIERVPSPPARPGTASPAVLAGLLRKVAEAPNGQRNNLLYWACCRAAERGVDTTPLVEAAVANGQPRAEAERTAQSATRAPGRA